MLLKTSELKKEAHKMVNLKDYAPFTGLLIFGNIENLVLASQGAVAHVNPIILGLLSLIAVVAWLLVGTYGTKIAIKYADYIEILGGLAIIILGLQSMLEAFGIL
jgi:putative Mn2+ efflux pump MntP